jgi:hypothetical protein
MATGDQRSNYAIKRYTSHNDMKLDFDLIRDIYTSIYKRTYRSKESLIKSGVLDSTVLIQVDFSNDLVSVYPEIFSGMTASGRVVTTNSTHTRNRFFENTIGYNYIVAINHCEIPNGVRNNPRSGLFEYDTYKNEVGTVLTPTSVTDNGNGTITFDITNLFQSGVDFSRNNVYVWLVNPLANAENVYIEKLPVVFTTPNNLITTAGSLGQTIISTNPSDYLIATLGIEFRRISDTGLIQNPFSTEHIVLGRIYSDVPGFVDVTFLNRLNHDNYHYITNEIITDISGCDVSSWSAGATPYVFVAGCYDPFNNQHIVIADEITNQENRVYSSYNGYEYYDMSAPAWDGAEDIRFLFNHYDGISTTSRRVCGTDNELYSRINLGTWNTWSGTSGKLWTGGGSNNKGLPNTKYVFVDGTNSKIYTADDGAGALTERYDFSSLSLTNRVHDVVYSNDDENPYWMILGYDGHLFRSVDAVTWTHKDLGDDIKPGEIVVASPTGTQFDSCRRCLTYDSFKKRWLILSRSGTLTNYLPTIHYSEDNGDTWIEVPDAFRFDFFTNNTTKQQRYSAIIAFYIGHRAIVADGKGNVMVKIIKARNIDDMTYGNVLTFISRDSGSNWEEIYPRQVATTDARYTGVDLWYDTVNGTFNSVQIGYDTDNTNETFYFTQSFAERFSNR